MDVGTAELTSKLFAAYRKLSADAKKDLAASSDIILKNIGQYLEKN